MEQRIALMPHPLETHYDSVVDKPQPMNKGGSTVGTYLVDSPTFTSHYLGDYLHA
jgi:hypothetical protein